MARSSVEFDIEDIDLIPLPPPGEFFTLPEFFGYLYVSLVDWFVTRKTRHLLLGTPFLIAVVLGSIAIGRLENVQTEATAVKYERAVVMAMRDDQTETVDLMLERLMQLKPEEPKFRFRFALSLVDQEKIEEARPHIEMLTGPEGYAPARMWLIEQSRNDEPLFPLTSGQRSVQLQEVIADKPNDVRAHRELAINYMERRDFRLAESHLLRVVDRFPMLGLPLYRVQRRLQRSDLSRAREYLKAAERRLEELIVENPTDPEFRIQRSQALGLLGDNREAEGVLQEGLVNLDSPQLRAAAVSFHLMMAQGDLAKSILNQVGATRHLSMAMKIDPTHPALPRACVTFGRLGVTVLQNEGHRMIAFERRRIAAGDCSPDEQYTFAQLLNLRKNYTEAADVLESLGDHWKAQLLLVRVCRSAARQAEADALISEILTECRAGLERNPEDAEAVVRLNGGLIVAEQFGEVISVIDDLCKRTQQKLAQLPLLLRQQFVTAALALFDATEDAEAAVSEKGFELLERARETGVIRRDFVGTIVALILSDESHSERADDLLTGLLAGGEANHLVYETIGHQALVADKPDFALRYLRLAHAQSPDDPILQNNLALALIRQSRDNAQEAMALCETALNNVPGFPDILSTRGEIHVARSRWIAARIDLEAALLQRPRDKDVRRLLVQVYEAFYEPRLAEEHRKKLEELMTADTE